MPKISIHIDEWWSIESAILKGSIWPLSHFQNLNHDPSDRTPTPTRLDWTRLDSGHSASLDQNDQLPIQFLVSAQAWSIKSGRFTDFRVWPSYLPNDWPLWPKWPLLNQLLDTLGHSWQASRPAVSNQRVSDWPLQICAKLSVALLVDWSLDWTGLDWTRLVLSQIRFDITTTADQLTDLFRSLSLNSLNSAQNTCQFEQANEWVTT